MKLYYHLVSQLYNLRYIIKTTIFQVSDKTPSQPCAPSGVVALCTLAIVRLAVTSRDTAKYHIIFGNEMAVLPSVPLIWNF